jgi:hypothetical protein
MVHTVLVHVSLLSVLFRTSSHFSHFAQRSALFAEIYDYSAAAILSFLDRFFNAEEKIRSTGANVRPEDITSIAL